MGRLKTEKTNLSLFLLSLILTLVINPNPTLAQEKDEIILTTYYPAPYGVYSQLQANRLAVGDTNGDGNIDSGDIPSNDGELLVSGNVGIGTMSPNANLDIKTSGSWSESNESLRITAPDTNYSIALIPYVVVPGNVGYQFRTRKLETTYDALTIDTYGNVGIGTTVPQRLLDVYGRIRFGTGYAPGTVRDAYAELSTRLDLAGAYINMTDTINTFDFRFDDTTMATISSTGGIFTNNRVDFGAGSNASQNSIYAWTDAGLGKLFIVGQFEYVGGPRRVKVWDNLDVANNLYVGGNMSADSITDRTPYPRDLKTAYNAVISMERLPDNEYEVNNKEKQLDHSKLSDFIKEADGTRNLSATVSAHNEVIKDLIKRIEALEKALEKN